MEYRYMIVAFLDKQNIGDIVEPPKIPHITVKKKFKLINSTIKEVEELIKNNNDIKGTKNLALGKSDNYGSSENQIIEVLKPNEWIKLHKRIVAILGDRIETRDIHFEGSNYLPHVTWKLKGQVNLNPENLINTKHEINKLYLIERIHPKISRAKILSIIEL